MDNSLRVTPKSDGTFDVEWDENDPNHSYLNDLTEDQLSAIIERHIKFYLSQVDKNES
jgi:hypothetical protein